LDSCFEQAVLARDVLMTDDCRNFLEHPQISGLEKRTFIKDAFSGSLNEHLNGFLCLLISKNRERIMASALTGFIDMVNRFKGRTEANVVSAAELDENQISALRDVLSKKLGKQVDVTVRVDPSLIGGLAIYVDGYYANHTIKERLSRMKYSIKSGGGIG